MYFPPFVPLCYLYITSPSPKTLNTHLSHFLSPTLSFSLQKLRHGALQGLSSPPHFHALHLLCRSHSRLWLLRGAEARKETDPQAAQNQAQAGGPSEEAATGPEAAAACPQAAAGRPAAAASCLAAGGPEAAAGSPAAAAGSPAAATCRLAAAGGPDKSAGHELPAAADTGGAGDVPGGQPEAGGVRGPAGGAGAHWARGPSGEPVLPGAEGAGGAGSCGLPLHHSQAQTPQPQHLPAAGPPASHHLRKDAAARLHLHSLDIFFHIIRLPAIID